MIGPWMWTYKLCLHPQCYKLQLTSKQEGRLSPTERASAGYIAYAPGTIVVNVTWIEREFNACQTPRRLAACTHLSSTISEI